MDFQSDQWNWIGGNLLLQFLSLFRTYINQNRKEMASLFTLTTECVNILRVRLATINYRKTFKHSKLLLILNLTMLCEASWARFSKLGISFLFMTEMQQVLSWINLVAIIPCKKKLLTICNSVFQVLGLEKTFCLNRKECQDLLPEIVHSTWSEKRNAPSLGQLNQEPVSLDAF